MSKDAASHVELAEGFLAKGRDLIIIRIPYRPVRSSTRLPRNP